MIAEGGDGVDGDGVGRVQIKNPVSTWEIKTAGLRLDIRNTVGGSDVDNYTQFTNGIALADGVTAPSSSLAGFAQMYIDTADGDLKIRFADGTVKTIVVDT